MKRGLFQWVVVLGLCGAGEVSLAGVFDLSARGAMQFIHGYQPDKTGPGQAMPRVDWLDDLVDVLPDLVDIFIDDEKQQQQDEQEAQWEREEEARRERERAEQAEQEAQWYREEAQRERQRAEEAERNEAEARDEARQSRDVAEQAEGTAQEAKSAADEAKGIANEAREAAQAAEGTAQAAKGAAGEAKAISQEAKSEAAQAKGVAQEAIGTAEQARGTAVEARVQVEQAHKRVGQQNTFVALLALLTLLALVLALRKPRQAIVRVAGNAMEPLRRSFKPAGNKLASGAPSQETARVALTGRDSQGRPVNIPLPDSELDPKRGGFTLGRHQLLVDRTLDDERISKRHARFSYDGHGYFVEDLNSRNGTFINGTRRCPPFKPMPIRPGDTVRLGGLELAVSA